MFKSYVRSFAAWLKILPGQTCDLLRNRWDKGFYREHILSILILVLLVLFGKYVPVECGYENGTIENLQLGVLFLGIILCCSAQKNKAFLLFTAAILFMLILREVSFGRTIFYPDPEIPNKFLRWNKVPYAPFVDPVMALYVIGWGIFFFCKKLYRVIAAFFKEGKLPLWHCILLLLTMVTGYVLDKCFKNFVAEETVELVFYMVLISGIGRAGRQKCSWLPEPEK